MIESFRQVIELWDARDALAAELPGVSSSQVSKWWQRDNIPSERWAVILRTERAKSAGLSADVLASLAEKRLAEVPR